MATSLVINVERTLEEFGNIMTHCWSDSTVVQWSRATPTVCVQQSKEDQGTYTYLMALRTD